MFVKLFDNHVNRPLHTDGYFVIDALVNSLVQLVDRVELFLVEAFAVEGFLKTFESDVVSNYLRLLMGLLMLMVVRLLLMLDATHSRLTFDFSAN